MKIIDGGVTAAKGFKAAGMHAGIKKGTKKDMAMIVSSAPCMAAGTFTTNLVKAAPVKWDQHVVYEHGEARAVVVNSGIANACTGAEGYGYCEETAKAAAEALVIDKDEVLVASRCDRKTAANRYDQKRREGSFRTASGYQRSSNTGSRIDHDNGYGKKRGCR